MWDYSGSWCGQIAVPIRGSEVPVWPCYTHLPFGHFCPYDPPSRTTAAYLSDLFLLLPDVAHNLEDTLGIGQPGHVSGQGLQLRHLSRDTADTPPGPIPGAL